MAQGWRTRRPSHLPDPVNARCLSEGVDIPALDAVLFLTPRGSQVDVVQSVGRVMRKAEGKKLGYIILPVVVPAGASSEEALADNKQSHRVPGTSSPTPSAGPTVTSCLIVEDLDTCQRNAMPLTALPTHGAPLMFVNRTGESKAFAAGLVEHRRRMDAEEISWHQLQNVIVFYGIGGVGKTELSLQLAEWIEGRPCPSSWGVPPVGAVSATVRWDLNASHGQADPLALLLQLRRGLSQVRRIWPAFDLPFAAFTQQARPGQRIILTRKNEQALSVQDVLSGLLSDAATAADIAGGGGGAAAATGLGHMLVSKAVNGSRARSAFSEFDGLKSLVEDCERYSGDAEEGVQLCVRILEMLSLTIDRMPADERPLIVVFVDTFERVQNSREAEGETALNWLVASSPYLFFVVTGRDSLRWHEEQQIHLVCRGSAMWPGLLLDGTPEHEPRQHLVGNLSEADTLDYLQRALASVGAKVESRVLPALYGLTHGWPLHLDAIVEVARDRASCGTLTLEDLGGRFPVLVNRLMRGFPDDERTAFNAACLLPYFDEQLVAHAGQVSVGTVRRLVQRWSSCQMPVLCIPTGFTTSCVQSFGRLGATSTVVGPSRTGSGTPD